MALPVCPLQDQCPLYVNSTEVKDHYTRMHHACNEFLSSSCEMGQSAEMFIRINLGETIACSVDKGKEYREKK